MMTDEQIVAIAAKSGIGPNSAIEFARAILAAPRQPGEVGAGVQKTECQTVFGEDCRYAKDIATGRVHCIHCDRDKPAASAQQDEREADIEQAFQAVYSGYNKARDMYADDNSYLLFLRGRLSVAFGLLQRVTGRASWNPYPAQQVQADAGAVASTGDAHIDAILERFKNPMTPYGVLLRALRIVAGATLMDMAEYLGVKPSDISAMEFGRRKVTYQDAVNASAFFNHRGINVTLHALEFARDRAAMSREQSGGQ